MMGRDGPGRPSKVARLIDEYDLAGLGDELERRWTAPDDRRDSLRDLATVVNRRVLETALQRAEVRPLPGSIAELYRELTATDSSAGDRTRARRRLERAGVDVAELREDFVSHAAVRTYLQSHRGLDHEEDRGPTDAADTTIARLAGRLEAVTADRVAAATRRGEIALGDHDVTVTVRVACRDCGEQRPARVLLDGGSCGCESE